MVKTETIYTVRKVDAENNVVEDFGYCTCDCEDNFVTKYYSRDLQEGESIESTQVPVRYLTGEDYTTELVLRVENAKLQDQIDMNNAEMGV